MYTKRRSLDRIQINHKSDVQIKAQCLHTVYKPADIISKLKINICKVC